MRIRGLVGLLSVTVALGLTGCSPRHSAPTTIDVDAPVALVDQAVHVRVTGLRPRETVTVGSQATDYQGIVWRGEATFTANDDGVVDLNQSAPVSGSYEGTDGMGLFWSMRPPTGDPDAASYWPQLPDVAGSFEVRLAVTVAGRELATRTLTREWTSAGVTHRTLSLGTDKVIGELFLPRAGTPPRPGVLVFGGSEGGVSFGIPDAALLASHGFPALALGYFGLPGLPVTLRDIPLEYFAAAARLLAAQPQVAGGAVVVNGYSRGSEAALLLANAYPDVVRGAILYAPNDAVGPGFPTGGHAWTKSGAPVPQTAIPVDRVAGPVLAIAGGDDRLWPSELQAKLIMERLDDAHVPAPHRLLAYPDAGHGVGTFPHLALGVSLVHPVTNKVTQLGGTREADQAARRDAWPQVLALLTTITARPSPADPQQRPDIRQSGR